MSKKLFTKLFVFLLVVGLLFAVAPTKQALAQTAGLDQSIQAAADRTVALQHADGGWGWTADDPVSYENLIGPIGKGLAEAYQLTNDPAHLTALQKAGGYLLAKTSFNATDYDFAMKLDEIFGVTTYTTYVKTNFYDKLALGTYVRDSVQYSTQTFVDFVRARRSGTQANMAAWDLGMLVVSAVNAGVTDPDLGIWIAGLEAEINELTIPANYDVIGLAGAVYGLAVAGVDFDPTAGAYAAANSTADLAAILATYQIDGGGFAWESDYVIPDDYNESIQETAYAILALSAFDKATYWGQINGAAQYALSMQLANGGWEAYVGADEYPEISAEILWGITETTTELSMDPATNASTICGFSGTTTVAVKVGPVDRLQAYDIRVNYNPAEVQILSVVNADDVFTGDDIFGFSEVDDETGQLYMTMTSLGAPITDLNGGDLVLITLKHKTTGSTVLTLDPSSRLDQSDGEDVPEYSDYPYTITQATSTFTVGDPVVYNETTLTDFCDLQVAMNSAVDGNYLTLLTDVTRTSNTNFGGVKDVEGNLIGRRAVTLDLNGHTIERTGAASTGFTISLQAGGDLTIVGSGNIIATPKYAGNTTGVAAYLSNDSTLKLDTSTAGGSPTLTANDASVKVYGTGSFTMDAGTLTNKLLITGAGAGTAVMNGGTINSLSTAASSVVVEAGDSFTMNNGTIGNGVLVSGPGATLVLNNGTINSAPGSNLAAVTGSGLAGSEGTQITINGGYVRNDHGAAIFHPQDGDLTITGGWVWGATGIVMKSGNLDISGPSHIYADGYYAEPIVSGSGQNSTGDAILIYGGTGYTGDITVNIHQTEFVYGASEMGQVTSEFAYVIREFSDSTTSTRTSSVKISDGLFESLDNYNNDGDILLFTEQLRNAALADEPNDTLLLTGGFYVSLWETDPAYYVFPPLETYWVDYTTTRGYMIREMAGQLAAADHGFVKYDTGSLGIFAGVTSGWTLTEVTNADIESAVVVLKSGETVLQTNTDIDLDTEFGTYSAFTSPFDIYGTFDYDADDNWVNVRPAEYGQTLEPTCVEATVLLKSGKELFASSCDLSGTYDSIKPIPVISSTDIQGYYLVGEERMFSVSVVNPLYGVNYTDGNYIYFTFQMDGVQVSDFKDGILWFWSPTNPTDYSEPAAGAGEWIAFNTRDDNETFYNCGENVCGEFGWASTGFPLPTDYSMTAYLKFTMLNADATAIPVSVDLVRALEPTTPVTSFTGVAYVYDKPTVTVSADDYYLAGVPGASTVTIFNPLTGYDYDNAVWFDMMIDVIADGGISAFSCTMNGHTWSGLEAFIDYTGVGATLRLGGADGYFTVNTGETLVVDCTITYATAGTYEVSGNMLHVVDKLAIPQETRVVSDNYSATALVYDKPTLTISQDPYFIAGEAGEFDVRIQNPATGVPYGNSVVFYLKWAGLNAGDISYPLDCYVGTQHWLYDATDFVDTVEGLQLRLDGADSYFTVNPGLDATVTCAVIYNKTGEITFTDEMVHVTDKIAGTERTVSDVVSATSKVFVKPVITSMDLPGSFQQGVMETVTIDITSMSLILDPNSYTLHIDLPEGTLVDYGTGTVTCGPTGCDIPVTLVSGANAIDLDITFNGPFVGPLTVTLVDLGFDPDRTLATLATTNNIVHANVALTTGTVTMQGRLVYDYAKFTLTGTYLGYGPYPSTTSDAAGAFSFANIIADEYTITTVMPRYLNIYCNVDTGDEIPDLCKKITLPGVDNVMETIKLRAGNAVWLGGDNEINLDDAGRVGTDWAKPFGIGEDVDLNINCGDVNFDGIVNIRDLALVGGNMDLTSAGAYGEWLP